MVSGQYLLKTLGCKANLYDSQLIEDALQKRGWVPDLAGGSQPQLCVINSCTVTNEADRQTRKLAKKLAQENPNAVVVITGCGAEVDPEAWVGAKGVHYVIGNQNKPEFVDLVLEKSTLKTTQMSHITSHILNQPSSPEILGTAKTYGQILSKHPLDRDWPAATDSFLTPPSLNMKGQSIKTRAFLKIQEGCNSFCTYCIIPYGRGPNRSLRPKELIQQVRNLVGQGVREIVLTGTNIGDYGTDWNSEPALGDLLEMILKETSLERLRVSSLDPTEITPQIFTLMRENPRFCPHFHVSLQSPHSRILRLMKRKYGFEEVKTCLEKIRDLGDRVTSLGGAFVGMDVITGFPGETDEEFEWGYQALAALPWSRLHVFPYSERNGTPATRLPNSVPLSVRVQRARRLSKLSLDRLTQHSGEILKQCREKDFHLDHVLLENRGESQWIAGYTPNYLRVLLPADSDLARNDLVTAKPLDLMIDSKGSDVAFVCSIS